MYVSVNKKAPPRKLRLPQRAHPSRRAIPQKILTMTWTTRPLPICPSLSAGLAHTVEYMLACWVRAEDWLPRFQIQTHML